MHKIFAAVAASHSFDRCPFLHVAFRDSLSYKATQAALQVMPLACWAGWIPPHDSARWSIAIDHMHRIRLQRGKLVHRCGSCLWARMGQNLDDIRRLPAGEWRCPCCQDTCNCSSANCLRNRRGLRATAQLVHEANSLGFKSVRASAAYQLCGAACLGKDMQAASW